MEESVDVGKQGVADSHCGFGGAGDGGPAEGLLRVCGQRVVVAVEGEEGAELHPAGAELHITISIETTACTQLANIIYSD